MPRGLNVTNKIELFCIGCVYRGQCSEPCTNWYDALEELLTLKDKQEEDYDVGNN